MGFVDGHLVSTFWVLRPEMRKITHTYDVTFLNKSYNEFNKVDDTVIAIMCYVGSDDEEDDESIFINNKNNNNDYN